MDIKIYSFFSGAGFLDLGFEDEKFEIVFVNEFAEDFLKAYKYARNLMRYKSPEYGYFNGDINLLTKKPYNKILMEHVPKDKKSYLVGFIGGPPCPDFSIAGKNKGIDGDNGKLTTSYKRLILKYEPDFFLFENVKGLWNTKKHREVYEKLKISFKRKGYILIDKLVNALEYGVPQDRERIFLLGIKYDLLASNKKEAQEIMRNNFNWGNNHYSIQTIKNINWPKAEDFLINNYKAAPDGVIEDLTVEYWFEHNHVQSHPNSNDYFQPKSLERFNSIQEGDVSKKSFKRLHRWRYSPTAAYGNNEVHLHPYKARRLSIAEALAIQSLPEEYVILPDLSLSSKFKTVGNGVPYLVSKGVARQIYIFMEKYCNKNKR